MFTVLHPTYTLRVDIQDRSRDAGQPILVGETMSGRQFANDDLSKTGCDEVLAAVRDALTKAGIKTFRVSLDKYEQCGAISGVST